MELLILIPATIAVLLAFGMWRGSQREVKELRDQAARIRRFEQRNQ